MKSNKFNLIPNVKERDLKRKYKCIDLCISNFITFMNFITGDLPQSSSTCHVQYLVHRIRGLNWHLD